MKLKFHYAWIIVFVTFLAFLAVQGGRLAFGAFVEPWEQDLSMDRGTTSLISTLSFVIYGVSQPIIGRMVDKYGARLILSASTCLVGLSFFFMTFVTQAWQLFALYSIVSLGVGGASNVAGTILVMNWFQKRRGLALGILEAGFGFGQMLIVPGSLFLIHYFDWRITNLVLAIFLLVVVFPIVLLLIRNHPDDKGLVPVGGFSKVDPLTSEETKEKNFTIGKALSMKQFWFIVIPFTVCGFTSTGLMDTHLIPYSHNHGFSTAVTSAAVSILAAFNIIGILLSGIISDRWSNRKLLILLYFSRALSIVLLVYTHNPVLLLIFAALFGLVDFATVAPTQLLAGQHFKRYSVGFIVGCLFMGHQIGSALGAYVPGLLFSIFGHYEYSLYLSIFLLVVAACLNILLSDVKDTKSLEVQG